jgi:protein SCO1/2
MPLRLTLLPAFLLTACVAVVAAGADPAVTRRTAGYTLGNIKLTREDGKNVVLADELNDSRPLVVNFIYTSCPGICPLSSQVFSEVQHQLTASGNHVHLVSISIDPENDTPAKLRAYAHKYAAGPGWNHYTGSVSAIAATEQAFGVYAADKMDHAPVTLVRKKADGPWVRFDGLVTADMLIREIRGESQAGTPPAAR